MKYIRIIYIIKIFQNVRILGFIIYLVFYISIAFNKNLIWHIHIPKRKFINYIPFTFIKRKCKCVSIFIVFNYTCKVFDFIRFWCSSAAFIATALSRWCNCNCQIILNIFYFTHVLTQSSHIPRIHCRTWYC